MAKCGFTLIKLQIGLGRPTRRPGRNAAGSRESCQLPRRQQRRHESLHRLMGLYRKLHETVLKGDHADGALA